MFAVLRSGLTTQSSLRSLRSWLSELVATESVYLGLFFGNSFLCCHATELHRSNLVLACYSMNREDDPRVSRTLEVVGRIHKSTI